MIDDLVQTLRRVDVSLVLDAFKDLGFKYATHAGITVSKNDVVVPPNKQEILANTTSRSPRSMTSTTWA